MAPQNLFIHKFIKRDNKNVILALHGTGGDENDLTSLAEDIFPESSILSLRGNIREHGMNRFFERFLDGSFDMKSIDTEVQKLKQFLAYASQEYSFNTEDIIVFGYSNGANFGLSFMFTFPEIIKRAVLLHPMLPFEPEKLDLSLHQIILTSGQYDSYTTPQNRLRLQELLMNFGAKVEVFEHEGGHEIREEEIEFVRSIGFKA